MVYEEERETGQQLSDRLWLWCVIATLHSKVHLHLSATGFMLDMIFELGEAKKLLVYHRWGCVDDYWHDMATNKETAPVDNSSHPQVPATNCPNENWKVSKLWMVWKDDFYD